MVMQVAAEVRDARSAGALTMVETSAQGNHAGHGLSERAVGLVGGVVRTLRSELEYNCKMSVSTGVEDYRLDHQPRHHIDEP